MLADVRTNAFDVLRGAAELRLVGRTLDRGAVRLLAGVLKRNTEVRLLDLTAAGIEDEGVTHLTRALETNVTLGSICLKRNLLAAATRAAFEKATHEQSLAQRRDTPLVVEY